LIDALTPRPPVSFSHIRLRSRNLATVSVFPCTVRNRQPHWLTVATTDRLDRLCLPFPAKTRPVRHDSTCGWFSARQVVTPSLHRLPTVLSCGAACRRRPFRNHSRVRPRLREPVKYALKRTLSDPFKGPGTPVRPDHFPRFPLELSPEQIFKL